MEGPRHPNLEEYESLGELLDKTFRSKLLEAGEKNVMLRQFPLLFTPDNREHLWVFSDNGRIVSHVGVLPRWVHIEGCRTGSASIGSVATDPEYRGRRLASQLMQAAINQAVEEGNTLMPISGGRSLYTRIGAADCRTVTEYVIDRDAADGLASTGAVIRPMEKSDLDAVAAFYRLEPVRFGRFFGDSRLVYEAGFARNRNSAFFSVSYEANPDKPAAYIVASRTGEGKKNIVRIAEYAGDRRLISGALRRLHEFEPYSNIENHGGFLLTVTPWDVSARIELEQAGIEGRTVTTGGTVLITDPVQLLEDLDAYQAERLGRERLTLEIDGDEAVFRFRGEEWECPAIEVSRVLLGSRDPDFPSLRPEEGTIAEVFDALTPVPTPLYGLSYV